MKTILKTKWIIMLVWLAVTIGLFLLAPNMEQLVREKGQIKVPDQYSSAIATKMLKELSGDKSGSGESQTALVFHDKDGLNSTEMEDIKRGVEMLISKKADLGISTVTTHFDQPELEKQMVSKDGKTVLVALSVDRGQRSVKEVQDALYQSMHDVKVEHYFTGSWLIDEDVVISSQEGLKKTESLTVIFILLILFAVFQSFVAPIIPLLAVGLSYLVAQSIVAILVDKVSFPLSTFTQIFMVAVMFGIGTDYCILLISRFKEELAHHADTKSAILATYRSAGKTVFFSGLAVMVGFSSIGLSTFVLYRSAVAVAIGVAILMIALVTVVPFFMAVLGKKIFWPSKRTAGHQSSKLWGVAGKFSLKRPLVAMLLVVAIVAPFLVAYKGNLSFNSLDELGDKYNSVKGFQIISDSFGPGDTMPTQIVLKDDKPLDHGNTLAVIEKISREVQKIEGVKTVRSVSRPAGDQIKDFQVAKQAETLKDGLGSGANGIDQIRGGLADASSALSSSAPQLNEAAVGSSKLTAGTNDLKTGVVQLGDALSQIESGLKEGTAGMGQLQEGLRQARDNAEQLVTAHQKLLHSYQDIGSNIASLSSKYQEIESGIIGISEATAKVDQNLDTLAKRYPQLQQDTDFLSAKGAASQASGAANQLTAGIKELNENLKKTESGIQQANAGYSQATEGQQALAQGLTGILQGIEKLQDGFDQAASGQGQIVNKMSGLVDGMDQLNSGQRELQVGFSKLNGQVTELIKGLDQSVDGLTQVSSGLKSAQSYLSELASSSDEDLSGWYIPNEALHNKDFQKALDAYMSPDRKTVTFDVVFEKNPYSKESLKKVDEIRSAINRAVKGTELENSTYAIGGVSSIYADLNQISSEDYKRTAVIMLIGLMLILILLFRSLIIPVYLIASLVLTYYTSMAVAEFIFVYLLGYSGLTWAVPFFAFVMLMALGIDYSIFLMDRFNEYRHLPVEEAIQEAMRKMGTVIMSAAVILGGTFAAMLPSGVLSLLEIATIVLTGLFLYALVILPFFIPVMVKLFGEGNWWPFKKTKVETDDAKIITTSSVSY